MKNYNRLTERRGTPLTMSMWAGDSKSLKIYNRLAKLENKIESGTLVNRDEYIDRLMAAKDISGMTDKELEFFVKHNARVRKQAVKEFAEKLKSHVTLNYTMDGEFVEDINIWSLFKDIENLVEEVKE